jgi:hypothetical protein
VGTECNWNGASLSRFSAARRRGGVAADATRQFLEIIPEGTSVPRDTEFFLKCFCSA